MASKNKWIKQRSAADNAIAATANLLAQMDVKVTDASLREALRTHHAYPSVTAIADTLEDYGVETMLIKISPERLPEIDLPCIAHINKNKGSFVVLTHISHDTVSIIDPASGRFTQDISEFVNSWTSAILLAGRKENAGERGYEYKRRKERLAGARVPVAIGAAVILTALAAVAATDHAFFTEWSILLGAKAMGLALGIFLLLHYFQGDSDLMKRICPSGQKLNCAGVLQSPAAKLLGIPMADLGALYFLGGMISLWLGAFTGENIIALLAMLNLLTLPYTFFSIGYQAFVARQWCWMCVGVQALFWIEFITFYFTSNTSYTIPSYSQAMIFLFSFLIPSVLWIVVRPALEKASKTRSITEELLRFKRDPSLFWSRLNAQSAMDMGAQLPAEIGKGEPDAPFRITMVSHPQCSYCFITHQFLDEMHRLFPGTLRTVVRFNCGDEISREVARALLSLAIKKDTEIIPEALAEGYKVKSKAALASWKAKYTPAIDNPAMADDILAYHASWCKAMGIKSTPVFFINDHPLPAGFTIYDIRPLLRIKQKEMEAVA